MTPSQSNISDEDFETLDLSPEEESRFRSILGGEADFIRKQEYNPLPFESIADFLYAFDIGLTQGGKNLSPWQVEITDIISQNNYSVGHKLRLGLVTCNGSGKDAYIICGAALFLACCKIRHRVVITTSSYTQLKNQTQNYIRTLANNINNYLAEQGICKKALIVKRDHIVCNLTGSEIIMFVTNEEGRAEGYHPFPDNPLSQVTLIINEAKTVPDEIFGAMRRCTFTRQIMVSSPGDMSGYFYNFVQRASSEFLGPGKAYYKRITAYDCDHIPDSSIEDAKEEMGESHPLFRSMYLAEFVSETDAIVIPKEWVDRLVCNPPEYKPYPYKQYGIDLSAAGGDETTIYKVQGNKVSRLDTFYSGCSVTTANRCVEVLSKDGADARFVFADDGGVGRAIIDTMYALGWKINRVLNQSRAGNHKVYGNRGAEMWFNVRRMIEEGVIILPKDDTKLESQLGTRHFKNSGAQGRLILESKADSRSAGRGSPDRADAVILAFTGLTFEDFTISMKEALKRSTLTFNVKDVITRHLPEVQVKSMLAKHKNDEIAAGSRFGDKILQLSTKSRADRPVNRNSASTKFFKYL